MLLTDKDRVALNQIYARARLKWISSVTGSSMDLWSTHQHLRDVDLTELSLAEAESRVRKELQERYDFHVGFINETAEAKLAKVQKWHRDERARVNNKMHRQGIMNSTIALTALEKVESERSRREDRIHEDRDFALTRLENSTQLEVLTVSRKMYDNNKRFIEQIRRLQLEVVREKSRQASQDFRNFLERHSAGIRDTENYMYEDIFGSFLLFLNRFTREEARIVVQDPIFRFNLSPEHHARLMDRFDMAPVTAYQSFGLGRTGNGRIDLRTGNLEYEHINVENAPPNGLLRYVSFVFSNELSIHKPDITLYGRGCRIHLDGVLIDDVQNDDDTTINRTGIRVNSITYRGQQIVFSYVDNRLHSIRDFQNRTISFGYTNNFLTRVTYPNGNVTTFEYNEVGLMARVVAPARVGYTFGYTENRVTSISDFSELRLLSETDFQTGNATSLKTLEIQYSEISPHESTAEVIDRAANDRMLYYFCFGMLGPDTAGAMFHFANNRIRNILIEIDGKMDSYVIQQDSFPTAFTMPQLNQNAMRTFVRNYLNGNIASWIHSSYNEDGFLRSERCVYAALHNSDGTRTSNEFTRTYTRTQDRISVQTIVRRQRGNNPQTQRTYNREYNFHEEKLSEVIDEHGMHTWIDYDSNDNMNRLRSFHQSNLPSGSGAPSPMLYSEAELLTNGKPSSVVDTRGTNRMRFTYANGREETITDPAGNRTSIGYNSQTSDISSITFSNSANTLSLQNSLVGTRGVLSRLQSGNTAFNYTHTDFGREDSLRVGSQTYVRYSYGSNSVTSEFESSGERFRSTFDARGKLTNIHNAQNNSEILGIEYNADDRPTRIHDRVANQISEFTYNADGTLLRQTSGNVSALLVRRDGMLQNVNYTIAGRAHNYTFGYDDRDRLQSVTLPTNRTESCSIGVFDRINTLTTPAATSTYTYVTSPAVAAPTLVGNNPATRFTRNGQRASFLVDRLLQRSGNTNLQDLRYTWDANENITEIREGTTLVARYQYDAFNRLTREDNLRLNRTRTFQYNANGDLATKTNHAYTTAANLGAGTVIDCLAGTQFGSGNLIGNPTRYRNRNLTWANLRNLTSVGSTTFGYDAGGFRIHKTNNNVTTTYRWLGDKLLSEHRSGVDIFFLYGLTGITGFILRQNNVDQEFYFLRNIQGDVTHVYRTNGQLVARYNYDAWGNQQIVTNIDGIATLNPIRYRGYYWDADVSFYYLRSRWYDPEAGRFINMDDPAFVNPLSPAGLNLFIYCGNNPVMNVDPDGRLFFSIKALIIIGLVAFGTGAAVAGGIAIANEIRNNGWNPTDWDWRQIGLSALGGGVAAVIASIGWKFPASWGMLGTVLSWSITFAAGFGGAVAGGFISGHANSDNWWIIGLFGGVGNVAARGISGAVSRQSQGIARHKLNTKYVNKTMADLIGNRKLARITLQAMKGLTGNTALFTSMNTGFSFLFTEWWQLI